MRITWRLFGVVGLAAVAWGLRAAAWELTHHERVAAQRARYYTWHGNYYHTAYGRPVALVVPPTAEYHTEYHWGVCGTRVTQNYHQFVKGYPWYYEYSPSVPFRPTPRWPSDTNQFGVYPVRGPW